MSEEVDVLGSLNIYDSSCTVDKRPAVEEINDIAVLAVSQKLGNISSLHVVVIGKIFDCDSLRQLARGSAAADLKGFHRILEVILIVGDFGLVVLQEHQQESYASVGSYIGRVAV